MAQAKADREAERRLTALSFALEKHRISPVQINDEAVLATAAKFDAFLAGEAAPGESK